MQLTGWRESDKGGIFGQWTGPMGSGSYAFSPSKEGSGLCLYMYIVFITYRNKEEIRGDSQQAKT
jgi:hypothetical protein